MEFVGSIDVVSNCCMPSTANIATDAAIAKPIRGSLSNFWEFSSLQHKLN